MNKLQEIAIFGAGGFGLEVAMLIEQINSVSPQWHLVGFFDDAKRKGERVNDWSVLGDLKILNAWPTSLAVVFALGISKTKQAVIEQVHNTKVHYPTLIHPSVIMGSSKYIEIGEGSIFCAGTIITTNIRIGRHVIFNLACTVGHETIIGDYSSFMPTCNISGEVSVGKSSFWGTGAKVINLKTIGDNTIIGAGAVVTKDIPDNTTAVGVPAKIIK